MGSHEKLPITVSASSSSEKPPSYEELRVERGLKDTFARLIKDHEEIQRLFLSVAAQLETTPKIGEGHTLCDEWNDLRQKHRKLYRDSQLNASQCASFLNNFSSILVPLSKSRMNLKEKTFMINKFLEAIPAHQNAARKTAERFRELGKQVEIFPIKVSSFLRNEAEAVGFWYNIWTGVEELCMSIWNALDGLLRTIVNTFKDMLDRIGKIRLSCFSGLVIQVDIDLDPPSQTPSHPPQTRSSLGQAKRDCKTIANELYGFEDAWHLVRLSCDHLLQNITMAQNLSRIPPAFEAQLKTAEAVYVPLVQCLLAYSTGKLPW